MLVQKYKTILDKIYSSNLPRLEDDACRKELAELWPALSDEEQDQVQNYSASIRGVKPKQVV